MIARLVTYLPVTLGVLIFVSVMVYPAGAVAFRAAADGIGAQAFAEPERYVPWSLFSRSVLLAGAAAALAVVIAMPAAYVTGRLSRHRPDGLVLAALLVPVLFPAMVYAFGWQRLLRSSDLFRCVWVWASWSWPVPALLIGAGWSRLGRRVYEEALVSASPRQAFVHAALPVLTRQMGVSFLVLFAFFLGEYGVPHACGLVVYATELLSRAEASADRLATLAASAPVALVIAAALGCAACIWRRHPLGEEANADLHVPLPVRARWATLGLAGLCVVPPLVGLGHAVPLGASLQITVQTYGREVIASIAVALLSGVTAVFMGACLAAAGKLRVIALAWALLWAALPGALIGEAVVTAYFPFAPLYDHWLTLVIGYVARFGWVGILAAWLARESTSGETLEAARSDGAGPLAVAWRIALAPNGLTLLCGVLIVTALSLSEVATTSLVRTPSLNPVSLILIEKFHRFEDGILVSLCLLLVAAAVPGAILAGAVARRR